MEIVYIVSFSITLCLLVTLSQQSFLPHSFAKRSYFRNSQATLIINDLEQTRMQHENLSLRKGYKPTYYSKVVVLPLEKFDKNGMIVLSQPKINEGTIISHILNKIVQYKLNEEKYDSLRQGQEIFNDNEIQLLEKIVDDIGRGDSRRQDMTEAGKGSVDDDVSKQLVFKFSDLVL